MVRVLIVEDQMIMQKYFEYLILQEPEFRLVKTVADAREAVKICSYSAIDLVLMDVQTFHNHDGLTAGKAIKEEHPATKVVIITSLIDPKILERAKTGCADSLWYKDHGEAELRDVIHRTLDGEHVFPDTTPDVEMNWITSGEISPRQLEMLRLYICGMSYSDRMHLMTQVPAAVFQIAFKRRGMPGWHGVPGLYRRRECRPGYPGLCRTD